MDRENDRGSSVPPRLGVTHFRSLDRPGERPYSVPSQKPTEPLEDLMANVPQELRYTEKHEYLKPAGAEGEYFVGITDYAQGELGDVVFVELPKPGTKVEKMQSFGTIEAVKAVSDLYAPLTGEVVAANDALDSNPALVNSDPYGDGWMIRVRAADPSQVEGLLDAAAYEKLIV